MLLYICLRFCKPTPSSSNNQNLDLAIAHSLFNLINQGNKEGIVALMKQILERVSVVPSMIQLERILNVIVDECNEGIQDTATGIRKGLAHIAETTSKVPGEMSMIFGKRINELIKSIHENLKKRDKIYFKQIADHKAIVVSLQSTNAESIKFLSNKVFSLSSSLLEFKGLVMQSMEQTNNAMALVHHQREQADARYQASRDDITLSRNQM